MNILQNANAAGTDGTNLFDAMQYVTNPYALLAYLFLAVVVALGWSDVPARFRGTALTALAVLIVLAVAFLLRNSLTNVADNSMIRLANDGNRSWRAVPGMEVELLDVASLEGNTKRMRAISGHAWNLTLPTCLPQRVFRRASVPGVSPEQHRAMTQEQWQDYLDSLGELQSDTVKDIPFVQLAITADGRRVEGPCGGWWLKGDVVDIPRADGTHVRLRIANIYNTKNRTSGEPEAINIELLN